MTAVQRDETVSSDRCRRDAVVWDYILGSS